MAEVELSIGDLFCLCRAFVSQVPFFLLLLKNNCKFLLLMSSCHCDLPILAPSFKKWSLGGAWFFVLMNLLHFFQGTPANNIAEYFFICVRDKEPSNAS